MKGKLLTLTALAAVALLAITATPAVADTELTNTTVEPDADTEAIRVIAENITNDTADVTVYEIADGNETQVTTGTLNTSTSDTDSFEYSTINQSATYRVTVTGDGAELLDVAKVQVVAAGGGGSGSGATFGSIPPAAGVIGLLAVLAGGAAVLTWRD